MFPNPDNRQNGRSSEDAIAEFIRRNGVTRCPTACAAPTYASPSGEDLAALREYNANKDRARTEETDRRREYQRHHTKKSGEIMREKTRAFLQDLRPVFEELASTDMTLAAISRELNRRGLTTSAKRSWGDASVRQALASLGLRGEKISEIGEL